MPSAATARRSVLWAVVPVAAGRLRAATLREGAAAGQEAEERRRARDAVVLAACSTAAPTTTADAPQAHPTGPRRARRRRQEPATDRHAAGRATGAFASAGGPRCLVASAIGTPSEAAGVAPKGRREGPQGGHTVRRPWRGVRRGGPRAPPAGARGPWDVRSTGRVGQRAPRSLPPRGAVRIRRVVGAAVYSGWRPRSQTARQGAKAIPRAAGLLGGAVAAAVGGRGAGVCLGA